MTVTFEFNYTVAYGGPHEIVDCILDVRWIWKVKRSIGLFISDMSTRIILFSPSLERMHTWLLQTPPALPNRPSKFACYPLEHKNPDLQSNGHGTCSPVL